MVRRLAVALLLVVGVVLRLAHLDENGSDVLTVTRQAIRYLEAGYNPYGHGYLDSTPPGAPYAYGPLALLYYAVMPERIELYASVLTLAVFALANRLLGLAWLALWMPLSVLASDGSNDTSVGLLLLGALVLATRHPRAGAGVLAAVVAVKPYVLAFLPPMLGAYGLSVLAPFLVGTAAAWGPALLLWSPSAILWSFQAALEVHDQPWYSLGALIDATPDQHRILPILQVGSGGLAALGSLR